MTLGPQPGRGGLRLVPVHRDLDHASLARDGHVAGHHVHLTLIDPPPRRMRQIHHLAPVVADEHAAAPPGYLTDDLRDELARLRVESFPRFVEYEQSGWNEQSLGE